MTERLIKWFVHTPEDTKNQKVREAYGTLGSGTGIVLNLLLSMVKMLLGLLSGSVAVLADGVNNLSDAGGSVMALVSVRMAQKPYDAEHPFGHGRMEYIGALAVGVLIAVFGIELLKSGIEGIITPAAISFSWISLALLLAGIFVKLWMFFFYRNLGNRADNPTLLAASKDSLSDVCASSVVLISLILNLSFGWQVDGYFGVVVALFVLYAAYSVIRDTVSLLLGGQPDKELGTRLIEMLTGYDGILGVHDLVLHNYGPGRSMASVHAEISADADLVGIHEVIDRAEREISETLNIPICIHMDPILTHDEETEKVRGQIGAYLASLKPPLKLHDFRRVPGDQAINLIFDVLLPPEAQEIATLEDGICAHALTLDARYRCVIHFDRDYFSNLTQ